MIEVLDHQRIFLGSCLRYLRTNIIQRRGNNPLPAEGGNVLIAQYSEHPGFEISASLELIGRCESPNDGILNQVVYEIMLAAQHPGKCT
jgi:hypothetical protein